MPYARWSLAGIVALGCGFDPEPSAETTGPQTTSATTNVDTGNDDSTSEPQPTTFGSSDDSDTEMMTTVPQPDCGNGTVEPPEECDDMNDVSGDGCEPDCTLSVDTQEWEDVVGGAAGIAEAALAIATDAMGNAYAAGYIQDAVGDANIWVRKYDSAGAEQFTVTFDPSGGFDDRAYGIAIDSAGNILVTGDAAVGAAESDIWVAKLDTAGAETWSVTVAGPDSGADVGNAIAVDSADNVIVGGYLRVANGDNDIWVGKYDAGGVEQWTEQVAGPDGLDDRAEGVAIDADDNIIVGGFISNEGFNRDIWLRRYLPAGTEDWTTIYDSVLSGSESGFAVQVAPDGSIGVAGTTPVVANNDDIWLGRFDSDGELLWMKDFGGPAVKSDAGLGLAVDGESNFIVVGYKAISDTDTDIWIRKWDMGGNVVWTQNIIGMGLDRDQANAAAADGDGNIFVAGEIRNEMNNNGDIWVAKFGP